MLLSFQEIKKKYSITHVAYSGVRKDELMIDNQLFVLDNKIDPLSLSVYKLSVANKRYLCLIGKGQSASGTGVQISYFVVFGLDKLGKVKDCYRFSSRFGNIHSIVNNYNGNEGLSYLKIVNGDKMSQFILTVNDIKNDKRINNGLILLDYKLNDKFIVLKNTLMQSFKIK